MKAIAVALMLLTSIASADIVYVDKPYPELKLKNGKVLRDAVIRTFDPEDETATILVGKNMLTTPLAWLPEEVSLELRQLAPPPKSAEQLKKRSEAAKETEQKEMARRLREEKRAKQNARQAEISDRKESVAKDKADAAVVKAAETKARNYFRYEYNRGAGLTFRPELEMDAPETVAGWTNRYRVSGKAYMQRYVNQGSFDSRTRFFEVLIELDAKGRAQVVDFTVK